MISLSLIQALKIIAKEQELILILSISGEIDLLKQVKLLQYNLKIFRLKNLNFQ